MTSLRNSTVVSPTLARTAIMGSPLFNPAPGLWDSVKSCFTMASVSLAGQQNRFRRMENRKLPHESSGVPRFEYRCAKAAEKERSRRITWTNAAILARGAIKTRESMALSVGV